MRELWRLLSARNRIGSPFWKYTHRKVIEGLCPGCDLFDLTEEMDLDAISVGLRHPPQHSDSSQEFYVDRWGTCFGHTAEAYARVESTIKSEADLERYIPPDPNDEAMAADVTEAVRRFKGKRFIAASSDPTLCP